MSETKVAVVIPARYASSRFPGKPLALLCGRPMIQHVYEKASASRADLVLVATDHEGIAEAVAAFGGRAVMTSENHPSGTDRIAAVIDELIDLMKSDPGLEMATVAVPAERSKLNENNVKVVFDTDRNALYFSRSMIPFHRAGGVEAPVYLHWGIYAYRKSALERFVALPPGILENCEKLEQLRALENGIRIRVVLSNLSSIGVDTPEDLAAAERRLMEESK